MNKNTKGFTLIEMVVVITVIGFLAAGVLASVQFLRKKAKDSRAQAAVQESISIAESTFNVVSGLYATTISFPVEITGRAPDVHYQASGDQTKYAIYTPLPSDANIKYCVDSSGGAFSTPSDPANGVCQQ